MVFLLVISDTCTAAHGLDTGDIVTIPQATWNCPAGNEVYPEGAARQFSIVVLDGEPNNIYISVGPSNTVHTYVNDTPGGDQITVRRARVGDNFQIVVAPGSYDEMLPIVVYAKNLCITGSSLVTPMSIPVLLLVCSLMVVLTLCFTR